MSTVEDLKNRTPQGFGVTVETLTPTDQDIRVLSAQLGRTVRDVIEIPARCVCGNPLVAERERIRLISGTDEVPEIENISAGGMPTRVKCLHAVIGHTLAVGRGINPMGDWGLDEIADWWTPQVCACAPSWRDA